MAPLSAAIIMQKKTILIVAEHFDGKLKPVTHELLTCSDEIQQSRKGNKVIIILGNDVNVMATELAQNHGVHVIAIHNPNLRSYSGELYKAILTQIIDELQPTYICIAHTAQGMDFAPAVAFRTGAACITGVERIFHDADRLCFGRSIFGGKMFAKLLPKTERIVLTLQPGSFKPRSASHHQRGKVEIRDVNLQPQQSISVGIKSVQIPREFLTKAKVIITAGRGIGKRENLKHIYRLARLFPKSAVGGSRPVCDLGWLEYGQQVGVTGATVTPDLYMACGVSGAMQHISGMRGSGFVVAINTDPNAAIFNFADVCVTEDLTTFIPALIEAYEKRGQTSD